MNTLRTIVLAILSIFVGILCLLVASFGISLALRLEPITGMEFTTLEYSVGAIWTVTGFLLLGLSTVASLVFINSWDNPTLKDTGLYLVCIGGYSVILLLYLPLPATDSLLTITGGISTLVAFIGGILMIIDKIRNRRMSKLAQ